MPKVSHVTALALVVVLGAACSSGSNGPRSEIFRSTEPTPSPGDDLINVPVILGPTQQQLDALNEKCGKVPGVVRTGIEPGMLFVEVWGFGPHNTQPVTNCVTHLPFYRATNNGLMEQAPASAFLPEQPSAAPS